jgi:CheY-like chemotaxis protein
VPVRILLVDDDRAALYALREVLSDVPASVVLAESGEEALRQVLRHDFQLVLLDVRLPKMDGFEVAAAIRSLPRMRATPIVFMSAHEDRRQQPRAEDDYWCKPLDPDRVRARALSLLAVPAPDSPQSAARESL